MNQKFITLLEELDELDEGFAGAVGKHCEEDEKKRDKVEAACSCGGKWGKTNRRSLKKCNHYDDCGAVKKGLVEDLNEELWKGVDAKQKKICIDTVKNPNKGKWLGGPTAEEAEATLKKKFGYTQKQIDKLKEDLEDLDEGDSFSREKYSMQRYGKKKANKATGEKEYYILDKKTQDTVGKSFATKEEAQAKLDSMKDKSDYKIYIYQHKVEEALEDLDEGRGRPKKDRSNEEPRVAGKRGRPKKDDIDDPEDDESKAGKRDLTLTATIIGGKGKNKQSAEETKTIKDAKADDIDKVVRDYENILSVKYANKWDFDEDEITVQTKDNLGWTGARAEDQTKDDEGSDPEDEAYSFGRMEK